MSRSGIDMISELLKEVRLLRKEVKILDQNVKRIANSTKASEIADKILNTPLKDWVKANVSKPTVEAVSAAESNATSVNKNNLRFGFETQDASKLKQKQPSRAGRTTEEIPTACMCHGKMIAEHKGKSVPLPDLSVKIFNDKDKLIKKTKTNRAGNWMSQLSAGNYVANIEGAFNGQPLYPVNLTFVVKPGISQLEVK